MIFLDLVLPMAEAEVEQLVQVVVAPKVWDWMEEVMEVLVVLEQQELQIEEVEVVVRKTPATQ